MICRELFVEQKVFVRRFVVTLILRTLVYICTRCFPWLVLFSPFSLPNQIVSSRFFRVGPFFFSVRRPSLFRELVFGPPARDQSPCGPRSAYSLTPFALSLRPRVFPLSPILESRNSGDDNVSSPVHRRVLEVLSHRARSGSVSLIVPRGTSQSNPHLSPNVLLRRGCSTRIRPVMSLEVLLRLLHLCPLFFDTERGLPTFL